MSFNLKVDKSGWEKLIKDFELLAQNEIQLGWFSGQIHSGSNVPMAEIAKDVEQGHVNGPSSMFPGAVTPPRPFMRVGLMGALNSGANKQQFQAMIKSLSEGGNVLTAMQNSLPAFEQTLKKIMLEWDAPRNAPATIAIKGFDRPLYHSGELIEGVTAKVAKKGSDA
jgi:hypothetical protein